jgi:hypothetical protein
MPHPRPTGGDDGGMVVWIPIQLQPRWRDLPALAWLATIRFGGPVLGLPLLGRLACAGVWLNTLAVLAGARAERACACYRHNAVVTVTRRQPRRLRWRRWLVLAAVVPAMVVYLGAPPLALMVAGVAGGAIGWAVAPVIGLVAAALATVVLMGLLLAGIASGFTAFAPRDRRLARAWAKRTGIVLVEAAVLAAAPEDRRAATVLVRALLAHADRHGIAVMARPRDARVAAMYRALHFAAVPAGNGRMLLREPRRIR